MYSTNLRDSKAILCWRERAVNGMCAFEEGPYSFQFEEWTTRECRWHGKRSSGDDGDCQEVYIAI